MVGGNWMNNDGLYVQYGTSKAVPTTAGDYLSYGETREIEFTLTLANTAAGATSIIGNTTFVPSGVFIETVELDVEVAAAGGTSISIGTMRADRTTVGTGGTSNVSFANAVLTASLTPAGTKQIYNIPTAAAGGTALGTTTSFTDGFAYLTLTNAGTYTNGVIKGRIKYRGIGTITQ